MSLLNSLFGSGGSTLANGDRLNEEAEFRNRRNRINNMDQMIGGAGKEIGLLQEQQRQREERKGRRAERENVRLLVRLEKSNKELKKLFTFAWRRTIECDAHLDAIRYLLENSNTQEVREVLASPTALKQFIQKRVREGFDNPENVEQIHAKLVGVLDSALKE